MLKRYRVRLRGQVRGVGLRYTVEKQAKSLGLSGWVENKFDEVVLEVEGENNLVQSFLNWLGGSPVGNIESIISEEVPLQHESDFYIKTSSFLGKLIARL